MLSRYVVICHTGTSQTNLYCQWHQMVLIKFFTPIPLYVTKQLLLHHFFSFFKTSLNPPTSFQIPTRNHLHIESLFTHVPRLLCFEVNQLCASYNRCSCPRISTKRPFRRSFQWISFRFWLCIIYVSPGPGPGFLVYLIYQQPSLKNMMAIIGENEKLVKNNIVGGKVQHKKFKEWHRNEKTVQKSFWLWRTIEENFRLMHSGTPLKKTSE